MMTPYTQTLFAWSWLLAGLLSGVLLGLGFHKEQFLGGYDSWRRRLVRLGHIAFFGTGLLNLFAALTWQVFALEDQAMNLAAWALVIGGITMPTVCALSAWHKPLRFLFPIPVIALIAGTGLFLATLVASPGRPGRGEHPTTAPPSTTGQLPEDMPGQRLGEGPRRAWPHAFIPVSGAPV